MGPSLELMERALAGLVAASFAVAGVRGLARVVAPWGPAPRAVAGIAVAAAGGVWAWQHGGGELLLVFAAATGASALLVALDGDHAGGRGALLLAAGIGGEVALVAAWVLWFYPRARPWELGIAGGLLAGPALYAVALLVALVAQLGAVGRELRQ